MRILIAEDDLTSRKLLELTLEDWGHDVIAAEDGLQAWQLLQQPNTPRLVILDWQMPVLSGLEICRRIRNQMEAGYIYVILLTAKKMEEDIEIAFREGVDDYLVKPMDENQLRHRLSVGMRVVEYEARLEESSRQLETYASQMEELAENRGRQLAHAERMATLGLLSAGIAHEINNPATFISGNVQVLNEFWPIIRQCLENSDAAINPKQVAFIIEELPKLIEAVGNGVRRITRIVDGLKTYARQGDSRMGACRINDCVRQALELCTNALKYDIKVTRELADDLPEITADAQQIEQVLVNLLLNAADAMIPTGGGQLYIQTRKENGGIRITVEDSGPGLPVDKLQTIWEPFYTTKAPGKGTGLGLSISHGIVENHGGTIRAENREAGGARFLIHLPLHRD